MRYGLWYIFGVVCIVFGLKIDWFFMMLKIMIEFLEYCVYIVNILFCIFKISKFYLLDYRLGFVSLKLNLSIYVILCNFVNRFIIN